MPGLLFCRRVFWAVWFLGLIAGLLAVGRLGPLATWQPPERVAQAREAAPPEQPEPDEDEEEEFILPDWGLVARYRSKGDGVELRRRDEQPALLLAEGESPDPRLEPRAWTVTWTGVLRVIRPGTYRFWIDTTGSVQWTLRGRPLALSREPKTGQLRSSELKLPFGNHELTLRFTSPEKGPVRLKIYWQCEHFGREPVPLRAWGHWGRRLPQPVAEQDPFAQGHYLAEEYNCAACHKPDEQAPLTRGLGLRPGPHLGTAFGPQQAAWIAKWLEHPQRWRPEAVMPRLFGRSAREKAARWVVARYLAQQARQKAQAQGHGTQDAAATGELARQGRALYQRRGCTVCHEPARRGRETVPPRATLRHLGQKWAYAPLVEFLLDPAKHDPGGRMPSLGLSLGEAQRVAAFLLNRDARTAPRLPDPPELPPDLLARFALREQAENQELRRRFEQLAPPQQLALAAAWVMHEKRCGNCHQVKVPAVAELPLPPHDRQGKLQPRWAGATLAQVAGRSGQGCLLPEKEAAGAKEAKHPVFGPGLDRRALQAFLAEVVRAPGSPAPAYRARMTLRRFNCLGCHARGPRGGLARNLLEELLKTQTEPNAEQVSPPPLDGVTEKLIAPYLKAVLLEGRRSRPWMALRMPQFAPERLQRLPEQLASLEAQRPALEPFRPEIDVKMVEGGRVLVGAAGYGCIRCHDFLGRPAGGTRAPELTQVAARINFAWFRRWMTDPQRIQPGTRMPTVFQGNRAPPNLRQILGGSASSHQMAIWQYLLVARDFPLPDGLEDNAPLEVARTKRPLVVRTFLPELTPRAMGLRFANDVHLAWDAQPCRLGFAWHGQFLDMTPVWTARGGRPAGIKGTVFLRFPPGHPWEILPPGAAMPTWSGRGGDPLLGAQPPVDFKVYPRRVRFGGYSLGEKAITLRYRLAPRADAPAKDWTQVEETLYTLRRGEAKSPTLGIVRRFVLQGPPGHVAWFNCFKVENGLRSWDGLGQPQPLPPGKTAPADSVLLVQQGRGLLAIAATLDLDDAELARWHLVQEKAGRYLVLQAPLDRRSGHREVKITLWQFPAKEVPLLRVLQLLMGNQ